MEKYINLRYISWIIIVIKAVFIATILYQGYMQTAAFTRFDLGNEFWLFIFIGFLAQLIDGSIGMAYGISCSSSLMLFGVPPAAASASVHTAEIFTTGASGLSHLYFRNVDLSLFARLAIPGIIGSALGAYLLSGIFEGEVIKPFIYAYILLIGIRMLLQVFFLNKKEARPMKNIGLLGFIGGCVDAIGGGGWGPLVTSNILKKGNPARQTIGTVNTTEFFVTLTSAAVFFFLVGTKHWNIILGLIIGGVLAAPLGAFLVKIVREKVLIGIVAIVLISLSIVTLSKALM